MQQAGERVVAQRFQQGLLGTRLGGPGGHHQQDGQRLDAAEPQCFVDDRDAISYLYTSVTTSFPKGVIVVDELPKTSTGKIQKNVVRDQHVSHHGG